MEVSADSDVPTEGLPRPAGSTVDVGATGGSHGTAPPIPGPIDESVDHAQRTDMDCDDVVPDGESDGYDELRERFGVGTCWTMADACSVLNTHGKALGFSVSNPVKIGGNSTKMVIACKRPHTPKLNNKRDRHIMFLTLSIRINVYLAAVLI